jgi:PAS domain S-box-containing protein
LLERVNVILAGGDFFMDRNDERELYQVFVQHIDDFGIFLLDSDGRVATWNIGAERVLGHSSKDIIGQPMARFYPDEDIKRGVPDQELQDAKTNGKASDDRWLVRKDGAKIWVSGVTVALPVRGALAFGKIIRDQTIMRQNAEHLAKLNRELVVERQASGRITTALKGKGSRNGTV